MKFRIPKIILPTDNDCLQPSKPYFGIQNMIYFHNGSDELHKEGILRSDGQIRG
jgi:hypothetical protein